MSFSRWRSLVDGTEVDVGSEIPDSGILHGWPISGTTTPIPDAVGSASISLNGGTQFDTSTDAWWEDNAVLFDGNDGYGVVDSDQQDPGDSGILTMTVHYLSISENQEYAFANPDTTNDRRLYVRSDNGNLEVNIADATTIELLSNPSENTTYRVGIRWDTGDWTGYLDGSPVGSGTYPGTMSLAGANWFFGSVLADEGFANVIVDYPRIGGEPWDDQLFQDEYEAMPWVSA